MSVMMIEITMIMRDASEIVVRASTSTACLVQARIIYDAFEPECWQSLRP